MDQNKENRIQSLNQYFILLKDISNWAGIFKGMTFPKGTILEKGGLNILDYQKMDSERYIRNRIESEQIKLCEKPNLNDPRYISNEQIKRLKNKPSSIIKTKEYDKLLKNPEILCLIVKEIQDHVAGEKETIQFIFLSICNIWVKNREKIPHIFVTSKSSAGKSFTCNKILSFLPESKVVYKNRISETALTYLKANDPTWTWDGKILYLEDVSEKVLNSDVHKVFLSEGQKETTITIKAGVTVDYKVNGQPLEITTTAESNPKVEVINRYNQISLDETPEQTQRVNEYTSKVYETGKNETPSQNIKDTLNELKRIPVRIPFASKIAGFFPTSNIKIRRDFPRFLELIRCSTALHQYQREQDEEGFYLSNEQDYEIARYTMKKLKLSEKMINLSSTEEDMFKVCKELTEKSVEKSKETGQEIINGFVADEAIAKFTSVGDRYWYETLKKFARPEYDLLSIELRKVEGVKKKVRHHIAKDNLDIFSLPAFRKIVEPITFN